MSKLSKLTDKDIYGLIEAMENGIAIKPIGEEAEALKISIGRAFAELDRRTKERDEKKSNEPTGKTGQLEQPNEMRLPTKAELGAWAKEMESAATEKEKEEARYHEFMEQKIQNESRVSVGRASETTVTIPVAEVKIGDTVRQLTQTEIVGYLKTYFKRVATGEKMKAGQYTNAYASEMGKTVWRLFDGWNLIYKETQEGSEWPPMVDVFPGWKNAQQAHKVTADVLWRWASNRKE